MKNPLPQPQTPVPIEGTDAEYPACPTCGQPWKVAHRAHSPHAVPVDPPNATRPTYRVTGCTAEIATHPDTGDDRRLLSWACDGHTMTVAIPAVDVRSCLAGPDGTTCRGGQPVGAQQHWGAVHECPCCQRHGFHYVRRDGMNAPACLSSLSPTTASTREDA